MAERKEADVYEEVQAFNDHGKVLSGVHENFLGVRFNDPTLSKVRFGSARFVSGWFGSVRFGSVRYGTVRFGFGWFRSVRFGFCFGSGWFDFVGLVRFGSVRFGSVRFGSSVHERLGCAVFRLSFGSVPPFVCVWPSVRTRTLVLHHPHRRKRMVCCRLWSGAARQTAPP